MAGRPAIGNAATITLWPLMIECVCVAPPPGRGVTCLMNSGSRLDLPPALRGYHTCMRTGLPAGLGNRGRGLQPRLRAHPAGRAVDRDRVRAPAERGRAGACVALPEPAPDDRPAAHPKLARRDRDDDRRPGARRLVDRAPDALGR